MVKAASNEAPLSHSNLHRGQGPLIPGLQQFVITSSLLTTYIFLCLWNFKEIIQKCKRVELCFRQVRWRNWKTIDSSSKEWGLWIERMMVEEWDEYCVKQATYLIWINKKGDGNVSYAQEEASWDLNLQQIFSLQYMISLKIILLD